MEKSKSEGFHNGDRSYSRMKMMVADPDSFLLQETIDHERLAEAILDRHYAALHFLAYSILGDVDEADDAVQEAIIRALERLDQYKSGSNMKAWLSSIGVNQCRDMIRRRKVRQRLINGLGRILSSKPPSKLPEESHVTEEAKTALWSSVDQLGEKHRTPIILRYVHKFSVREISSMLRIREGTVHSRLHYGCRKLKWQLAINDYEGLIEEIMHD